MTRRTLVSLTMIAAGWCCWAAQAAPNDTAFACTAADGTAYLTNEATGDKCEPVGSAASATDTAAAATDAAGAAAAAAPAPTTAGGVDRLRSARAAGTPDDTSLQPLETRLSNYRDLMVQGAAGSSRTAPAAASNPAVNRRYLKLDKSTFMSNQQ